MKKTICTIFCFVVVFYIFPVTAYAKDFTNKAISVFQEYRKLNEESRAAFMSGDRNFQKEKGKLLAAKTEEYNKILKSLPGEYCADPDQDLLSEYIKTMVGTSDEYPTYVLAELYACDPESVKKEILSLKPEDQKKVVEDLSWGFKNITYKVESLPNYKDLKEKLKAFKKMIRGK